MQSSYQSVSPSPIRVTGQRVHSQRQLQRIAQPVAVRIGLMPSVFSSRSVRLDRPSSSESINSWLPARRTGRSRRPWLVPGTVPASVPAVISSASEMPSRSVSAASGSVLVFRASSPSRRPSVSLSASFGFVRASLSNASVRPSASASGSNASAPRKTAPRPRPCRRRSRTLPKPVACSTLPDRP